MTRETKIGLLVGLGFIVVFAVLLSHNGTGPSPTQTLPPVALASPPGDNTQPGGAQLTPSPVSEQPTDNHTTPAGDTQEGTPEWRDPINGQMVSSGTGDELPAPIDFQRTGIITTDATAATDGGVGQGMASAEHPRDGGLPGTRMVPPVVDPPAPQPTERPVGPAVTVLPVNNVETASPAAGNGAGPTGGGTHASAAPKPYIVHKGDTLVKITKEFYGKSTPDVITLVVDANKGTVKGRDSLREGQTLMMPPLPADMFEHTPGATGTADLKLVDRMINPPDGRVPDTTGAKAGPTTGSKASKGVTPATAGGTSGDNALARGGKAPDQVEKPPAGTDSKKVTGAAGTSSKVDGTKLGTAPKDGKKTPSTAPRGRPGMRVYEIQPKDTFTSIAQRELGSRAKWAEIKQMNKGIDPAKMKPGMKINIPVRSPVSSDMAMKQVTA